jgi:pyridoxine 5-phosphate synthase
MVKLGVNIDHIATLRQARRGDIPSPVLAARVCERAGAKGITAHLREDRRHIQDADIRALRKSLTTKLNLEMAVTEEIVRIAVAVKPDDVCLVPEKRQELTTEGGLDVCGRTAVIAAAVQRLKKAGIRVSLFIDPAPAQVEAAAVIGADCVELHTGAYAEFFSRDGKLTPRVKRELVKLTECGALARSLGLVLNAGHGLDYRNVRPVARIVGMHELNIGFSIIARAVFVGLDRAVREMKELISV